MVQHRALRCSTLAMDHHGTCGYSVVPRPEASGKRLHDDAELPFAAPVPRNRDRRIPGCLHVNDCDAAELGRVLPGFRFLPALPEAESFREPLRRGLAVVYDFAGDRIRLGLGTTWVDCLWVDGGVADRSRYRSGLHPALVLVEGECLERNFCHGLFLGRDLGVECMAAIQ